MLLGRAHVPLPLPLGSTGGVFFAQFVFVNTATCQGPGALSASDALAIRVR